MRNLRPAFQKSEEKHILGAGTPATNRKIEKPGHPRVLTFNSLLGVVSATVLIDTLILIFAGATVWALGGYLQLALLPFALLTLAAAVPTMWACVKVAVLAYDAETDPENNSHNSPQDNDLTAAGVWPVAQDGHARAHNTKRIG